MYLQDFSRLKFDTVISVEHRRGNSIVTRLRAGRCQSKRFLYSVHIGAGAHSASTPVGTSDFRKLKRSGREANHSPASSAEVNNTRSHNPVPLTS